MTRPLTPGNVERFSAVMGACGTMWSWWLDVEYHDGGDFDRPTDITFTVENPYLIDGPDIVKRVTPREILHALRTACETVPAMEGIDPYDEDLDLDASTADCVLQIAVLGEVVYG